MRLQRKARRKLHANITTAHQAELIQEFSEFLSIPNVAADPASLKRNADLLVEMLKRRNVDSQLLSIPGALRSFTGKSMCRARNIRSSSMRIMTASR